MDLNPPHNEKGPMGESELSFLSSDLISQVQKSSSSLELSAKDERKIQADRITDRTTFGITQTERRLEHPYVRYPEVDFLRGIAVVLMMVFHVIFDLKAFGTPGLSASIDLPWLFWEWFPNLSSTLFLLLVGVSAVLATKQTSRPHRKLIRQSLKIFTCAALVTLGSFVMTPQSVIHFGVLHCIGISLLLASLFLRYTRLSFVLGMGILAGGDALSSVPISTPWFLALGLKPVHFRTGDYFPLVPFFGLVLLGISLGRAIYVTRSFCLDRLPRLASLIQGNTGKRLQMLGRHSLLIYLVHQPALFLVFSALGLLRTH